MKNGNAWESRNDSHPFVIPSRHAARDLHFASRMFQRDEESALHRPFRITTPCEIYFAHIPPLR